MSDLYSFREGPSYRPLTPDRFMTDALDAPLSIASTYFDQAKGGILESFGLGTAIRDIAIPEGAEPPSTGSAYTDTIREVNDLISPRSIIKRLVGTFDRSQPAMTEDQYKASPNYRENIPWDAGMTEERAAALASWDDAKKVRDYYAQKRPITAFFGNLSGQALDPINYIPVAGPLVKAAAAERFGIVAGSALTASLDAAGNTAAASLITAPARAAFGDDVSWQTTVSQIATAALIGGAFGGIAGAVGKRIDTRLMAEADQRLSTLRTTQEARIALNEGIDALVRGEDVNLSPNATEPIARVANDIAPAHADLWGFGEFQPKDIADTSVPGVVFHGTSKGEFDQFDPYQGEYGLMGAGSYFTEDPRIAAEYTTKGKGKSPAVYEAQISAKSPMDMEAPANVEAWLKAFSDYIDPHDFDGNPRAFKGYTNEQMYREVEDGLSQEMIPSYEGAEVMQDGLRGMGHDSVTHIGGGRHKDSKGVKHRVWVVFDPEQIQVTGKRTPVLPPSIDTTKASSEPPTAGRAEAEAGIAKSDNTKALSEQYRVDPQTGAFGEEGEIAQLKAEGRLTEEDEATLAQSQAEFEIGAAYAEALKSVAGCLL